MARWWFCSWFNEPSAVKSDCSWASVRWVPGLRRFDPRGGIPLPDQLLVAESAANRALGSSGCVWLALHGRKGSREGGSCYLGGGGKEGSKGEGKEESGVWPTGRWVVAWVRWGGGEERGIRHMSSWGLNFPAIRATPGLVLIGPGNLT